MRQSMRDKRNYIIVVLLIVVLVMTVGFAAFSTSLQINGTANISTNWCVGFDNTKTTTYEITKGKSTGTNPSATMGYDGTACSTNYVPIANLGATFYQPGDKIEYTLTIANKGSVDAAIESITVDGTSVTSNQTKQKGNIIWKVYMPEDVVLSANTGSTTMVVSAEFQNTTDLSNYTLNESQTITVGVNAVQGSAGMGITPSSFTGTIYRNNTKIANIGSSIVQVSGTKYVITDGNQDAPVGPYESQSECQTALEGFGSPAGYSCQQKTGTFGGVGEYTTNASTLNKTYYLKHDVVDDIITASYVCFVTDTEHCMQGGNSSYYSANKRLLQGQESWFNSNSGSCTFGDAGFTCSGGGFSYVSAYSAGGVSASVSGSGRCDVHADGYSDCGVSGSGGGSESSGGEPAL